MFAQSYCFGSLHYVAVAVKRWKYCVATSKAAHTNVGKKYTQAHMLNFFCYIKFVFFFKLLNVVHIPRMCYLVWGGSSY